MESLVLDLKSIKQIRAYMADNHLMHYEATIYKEMLNAIKNKDQQQLDWFCSFGDSFRTIAMNVHAYRKGLEFGFTEIAFDKYGWFVRPEWQDKEELAFGDTSRYGNYSTITLGRGINGLWTYAMSYSYGVGGGGYGLSVYDKQLKSRDDAFHTALAVLKAKITEKIGSTDTLNNKQPIILGTLKAVEKAEIARIQLTLF